MYSTHVNTGSYGCNKMTKYFCRLTCADNQHTRKSIHFCLKEYRFLCCQCTFHSAYLKYTFSCISCFRSYCVIHFIQHKEELIHFFKANQLNIYDPCTKFLKKVSLKNWVESTSDTISCHGKIYIIGGNLTDNVHEVDIQNKSLILKGNMLCKKYEQALCTKGSYIISIGGIGTNMNGALRDCQQYSTARNKWVSLPNMLCQRSEPAVFNFDNVYIYLFGGWIRKDAFSNTVERLGFRSKKWEELKTYNEPSPRYELHGMQINKHRAIIYGSYPCPEESFLLEFHSKFVKFIKGPHLAMRAEFYRTSSPVFDGAHLYDVDYQKNIHFYDSNTEIWKIIKLN